MHGVEYGSEDIKDSGIGYAILDTGTSLLYLGTEDYANFANQLMKDVPELDCDSQIYCFSNQYTCDELTPKMSDLKITLQENHYTIPPEGYTFKRGNIFQRKCTVAVSYTDSSGGVYILGDTFLRNFVTEFDYSNGEMRLTINKFAPDGVKVEYKMSGWKIFGIIVACILAVAFLVWIIFCCVRCRKKKAAAARGYQ